MKKPVFCCAILLAGFLGYSQIREKGDIEIAPIIGSSSTTRNTSVFDMGSVSGIELGVVANYFFNEKWSIRSGFSYQTMGVKNISSDYFIFLIEDYSEESKYLTIPVVASYHFGSTRKWHVNGGISGGYLLDIEADFKDGEGFVDIKEGANQTQFGVNAGVGYKFEITPRFSILVENSTFMAITDVHKERSGKNIYISFRVGAVFKL